MNIITKDGIIFEVTRKDMKNMRMRLMPNGHVAVSAPHSVSEKQLDDFLTKGVAWAKNAMKKSGKTVQDPAAPLEYIYHLGKKLPVVLEKSPDNTVRITDTAVIVRAPAMPERTALINTVKELQRTIFKSMLPALTAECEKMANVAPYEWRIRDMRTKWGTCNVTGRRIWLRLELISYPVESIKAVMIHELTHLYEKNHSPRFYALTRQFYPAIDTAHIPLNKSSCDWW